MPYKRNKKKVLRDEVANAVVKRSGAFISMITTGVLNQILGMDDSKDMKISGKDIDELHRILKKYVEEKIYTKNRDTYDKLIEEKIIEHKDFLVRLLIIEILTTYLTQYYSDNDMKLLYMMQTQLMSDVINISIERGANAISIRVSMPQKGDDTQTAKITHDTMFR